MPGLESGYSEYLLLTAQCYLGLGYSVIPVYGNLDPERAKICPIPWTYFQQRRAALADLRAWFTILRYGGVAIVTGRISGLIALDFDDAVLADDFARRFPDLTETWAVQSGSRRLPHYYYRLPLSAGVVSQRRAGIDLQSGGRYIVAPPTRTTTMEWRVLRPGQPRMLSERDLKRISGFMAMQAPESAINAADQPSFAFLPDPRNIQEAAHPVSNPPFPITLAARSVSDSPTPEQTTINHVTESQPRSALSADKLISRYLKLAPEGRNEALFHTAIWARDHGWTEESVKTSLVELHVRQLAACQHRHESPEQRRREAVRTIQSAYSRPPRSQPAAAPGLLSNNVREALLQRKQTAALRVLEAFTLAGWQPGHRFTEREARDVARRYAVGDWSVRKALREAQIFEHPPANDAAADENTEKPEYKKCFFVFQPEPTKNKPKRRGRPVRYYVIPDQETLCKRLGIQPAPASRVDPQDLRSCRTYRQGVLRDLIARRPGSYSRDWMASYLGVSVTTTRRYTQDEGFSVTATYQSAPLHWRNLDSLIPPDMRDARPGSFLEDRNGKRYPPILPVAQRLLGKSGRIWFRWRGVNHYAYAKSADLPSELDFEPHDPSSKGQVAEGASIKSEIGSFARPVCSDTRAARMTEPALTRSERPPARSTSPLSDARLEDAAKRVYETMAMLDSGRTLSLANARALVVQYGAYTVENMVETIKKRGDVRNPAGFLTEMLAARCRFMTDESLTIAEIYAAERAFIVTRELNPQRALSWKNACNLARDHGQAAVENAIKILGQRNVKNPAGLLVRLLRSEPGLAAAHMNTPDDSFVEHVYNTLRQINPQRALSRNMIRRIVAARGRQALTDALRRVKQRGDVQNPAGYLVTLLRVQRIVRKKGSKTPARASKSQEAHEGAR